MQCGCQGRYVPCCGEIWHLLGSQQTSRLVGSFSCGVMACAIRFGQTFSRSSGCATTVSTAIFIFSAFIANEPCLGEQHRWTGVRAFPLRTRITPPPTPCANPPCGEVRTTCGGNYGWFNNKEQGVPCSPPEWEVAWELNMSTTPATPWGPEISLSQRGYVQRAYLFSTRTCTHGHMH